MVVKPTPTPPPAHILRSIAMALAPPPDDWTDTSLNATAGNHGESGGTARGGGQGRRVLWY